MSAELEWTEGAYDAALHLLDRQLVDVDGLMVAKVDDVELTEQDGTLVVTGLLVGPGALIPRLGGRAGQWLLRHYRAVKVTRAAAIDPDVVDIAQVRSVTSQIDLAVPRTGLLRPRGDGDPPRAGGHRRRIGDLLGLRVLTPDGATTSHVVDVRLSTTSTGSLTVSDLVVDRHAFGGLLGYDRAGVGGPWVVARVVRWLHRHALTVPYADCTVDWEAEELRVDLVRHGRPLTPAR